MLFILSPHVFRIFPIPPPLHQSHLIHQYYSYHSYHSYPSPFAKNPSITRLTGFSHKSKPPGCLQLTTRNGTILTRIQTRCQTQAQCHVLKCSSPCAFSYSPIYSYPGHILQPNTLLSRRHSQSGDSPLPGRQRSPMVGNYRPLEPPYLHQ